MRWKLPLAVALIGTVAAGTMYYRRHHSPTRVVTLQGAADPFRHATSGTPASTTGRTDMTPALPPTTLHSTSLDQSLKTIQEVNQINRLNQQQAAKKPSDQH